MIDKLTGKWAGQRRRVRHVRHGCVIATYIYTFARRPARRRLSWHISAPCPWCGGPLEAQHYTAPNGRHYCTETCAWFAGATQEATR